MSRPIHFEIHASDPPVLVDFYTEVFGWKFTQMMPTYWLIDTGSEEPGISGAMVKRPVPATPEAPSIHGYICSLGVESVDDLVARAVAKGAIMAMHKFAIPGVGWRAYIRDPDGNILGLHQADAAAT